ncbi:MAG: peptidase C1, partial [bacterium]|nr:peptidase C1 [bacterium]
EGKLNIQYTDKTGRIPSPVSLSHVRPAAKRRGTVTPSYPAKYDLRDYGKVTGVRDQGSCGSCWAHATYASMESCYIPTEYMDFSEQDMVDNNGFDIAGCDGGNSLISTAYLVRWSGAVLEADVPYGARSDSDNSALVSHHLQQAIWIPQRENGLDNDILKHCITTYGALYIAMYADETSIYYNSFTSAYYVDADITPNHDVTIVGWDDDYSASNFRLTPPGNGAFIVKNSWGTNFGIDGYFYVSYYDQTLTDPVCFSNTGAYTNYGNNYQYDTYGWLGSLGYGTTVAYGANIFTANSNQPIQAVGLYTTDSNVQLDISVYKDVSDEPASGTLVSSKSTTIAYPGYHTIPLDSHVPVANGEAFSVVVRYENDSYTYPIPCEGAYPGFSSDATANAGESYISADGTSWEDVSGVGQMNVCIKAFSGFAQISMDMQAARETVAGWIVSRDIAKVSVSIGDTADFSVNKIIIYRKTGD